jgi:hypothetical protein
MMMLTTIRKKIMNEMNHFLLKNSKRRWRLYDPENLKIDQRFGYLCELVNYLDDDING